MPEKAFETREPPLSKTRAEINPFAFARIEIDIEVFGLEHLEVEILVADFVLPKDWAATGGLVAAASMTVVITTTMRRTVLLRIGLVRDDREASIDSCSVARSVCKPVSPWNRPASARP